MALDRPARKTASAKVYDQKSDEGEEESDDEDEQEAEVSKARGSKSGVKRKTAVANSTAGAKKRSHLTRKGSIVDDETSGIETPSIGEPSPAKRKRGCRTSVTPSPHKRSKQSVSDSSPRPPTRSVTSSHDEDWFMNMPTSQPVVKYTAKEKRILDGDLDVEGPPVTPRRRCGQAVVPMSSPLTSMHSSASSEGEGEGESQRGYRGRTPIAGPMRKPAPKKGLSRKASGFILSDLSGDDTSEWNQDSQAAVSQQVESEEDEDDEVLPDAATLLTSSAPQTTQSSTQRRRKFSQSSDQSGADQGRRRRSPSEESVEVFVECDMSELGVPLNSLAYCRHAPGGHYWPAVVRGFRPARSAAERARHGERYQLYVVDFPGSHLKKREEFVLPNETSFATIENLGKFEHVVNRNRHKEPKDAMTRGVSPDGQDSAGPSTPTPAEFARFTYRAQVRNVEDYLSRVIRDEYGPTLDRSDYFYARTLAGTGVIQPTFFGDISQADIDEYIVPEIMRWALRGEMVEGTGDRPRGSERYEALTLAQKKKFVTEVVLQQCLYAMAARSSEFLTSAPDVHELRKELVSRDTSEGMEEAETEELRAGWEEKDLDHLRHVIAHSDLINMMTTMSQEDGDAIHGQLMGERTRQRELLGLPTAAQTTTDAASAREGDEEWVTITGRPDRKRTDEEGLSCGTDIGNAGYA